MSTRLFTFVAGAGGPWRIVKTDAIVGESLPPAARLNISSDSVAPANGAQWALRGITSNERYVERGEKAQLVAKQQGIGRPDFTCEAMIQISKRDDLWEML